MVERPHTTAAKSTPGTEGFRERRYCPRLQYCRALYCRRTHLVLHWVSTVALDPPPVVGGLVALWVLWHMEPKHDVPPAQQTQSADTKADEQSESEKEAKGLCMD